MLGAIIGDTVGSIYEFNNIKTTDFPFFSPRSNYTDDSVMSMAVADWLLRDAGHYTQELEQSMLEFANKYPCPMGGYGGGFHRWLFNPEFLCEYPGYADANKAGKRRPYNSWGNGSAMRVSACGWVADTLEETERIAKISAEITHNHPEGIKGAQATAAAIFMARTGKSKAEIKGYISAKYGYNLNRTCDEIRPKYEFDGSCQGTVPEAIIAFLESTDFESAIRLAVSLGGDSDTLACITGGIAEAYYKVIPAWIVAEMWHRLPADFRHILDQMQKHTYYKPSYFTETMDRFTPDFIKELRSDEIFVFGSNLAGAHGGGAAYIANAKFGAEWGVGVGPTGQCYAIPTMQGGVETIKPYVDDFIEYAKQHPGQKFLVTRIGCGIAGFTDDEIAPLFADATKLLNVSLPEMFWKVLGK